MKITKDYPGLVDIGWAYKFEGSIKTMESIEIDIGAKWLYVTEGIESGGGIEAGLSIICKQVLSFRFNLFAGTATWKKATPEEMEVICAKVNGGEIKSGTLKIINEKP